MKGQHRIGRTHILLRPHPLARHIEEAVISELEELKLFPGGTAAFDTETTDGDHDRMILSYDADSDALEEHPKGHRRRRRLDSILLTVKEK